MPQPTFPRPALPDDDPFFKLVDAAARDGVSYAAFLDVLRTYDLTAQEREAILLKFTRGH